jgi:hypothetical protein
MSGLERRTDSSRALREVRKVPKHNNGSRASLDDTVAAKQSCRQLKADDGLLAGFKLTASALLDAPFSDGGRAGTKPSGFELLRPRPRPFRKASPARREGSQTTMRARLCPISVRIRELSYSSSLDHAALKGPIQGQIILG